MQNTLTINSYFLLKSSADKLLLNILTEAEKPNFAAYKRALLDDLDKQNCLLPGELILKYYNYCIENFKTK